MGVGGNFWELLKPYARHEGIDFLRDKKVAIDLSFWIVQHETAMAKPTSSRARTPHLRITFFRTVNLFAKMGAFPVFIVDGDPSPLKARARIERFCRATGIDLSSSPRFSGMDEGVSVKRNVAFTKCVAECVELLEYLGMPMLRASGEAEALCAQLNSEGHVDACITADSDALLFGAKCVIKCLRSNSKEPFECYNVSDVEAGLGLKRKQLIAISLLVGNDHDLHGVRGIGVDTAVRFVQLFSEDEVLNRLCEVGKGNFVQIDTKSPTSFHTSTLDKGSPLKRSSHCSNCGHPGLWKAHLKIACKTCFSNHNENCIAKPVGFKCECSDCDKDRQGKEQKKHETWQNKVCQKITAEDDFPNMEIIEMYLNNNNGSYKENDGNLLSWEKPKVDSLVDFLSYHQHWEPSYTRQRILPMLSAIFLRDMASNPGRTLLFGQYEFHSIQRVKIRYGHPFFVVKWKRAGLSTASLIDKISCEQSDFVEMETCGVSELNNLLDEPEVPEILIDEGSWFLVTDEDVGLVEAAFPKEVDRFLREKEIKESNSKRRKSSGGEKAETPKSTGIQLSITQFYRSNKSLFLAKPKEDPQESHKQELPVKREKTSDDPDQNFSKSVRRRLLFG